MSDLNKYELEDIIRRIFKSEFTEFRRELGLTNDVSQAYAFRRYGEHYIKKWHKEGLNNHAIPGKRTRRYYINEIDKFAANDRLYQQKIRDKRKKEQQKALTTPKDGEL